MRPARLVLQRSAERIHRCRRRAKGNGRAGAAMVREETSWAVNDARDARGNGLMDLEGRGITMMGGAGRVGFAMVPLGGLAIAMRDVVWVRVHCASTVTDWARGRY